MQLSDTKLNLQFCPVVLQPIELLPKSFRKFEQGLESPGLSESSLFEAYSEYETQRKRKVAAAKRERVKLKETDQILQWSRRIDSSKKEPTMEKSYSHHKNRETSSHATVKATATNLLSEKVYKQAFDMIINNCTFFLSRTSEFLLHYKGI